MANPKTPMPYAEVRRNFFAAQQKLLSAQGPVTQEAILAIQQSRKYAHSPCGGADDRQTAT